jgi:hypothetical protein
LGKEKSETNQPVIATFSQSGVKCYGAPLTSAKPVINKIEIFRSYDSFNGKFYLTKRATFSVFLHVRLVVELC